MSQQDARNVAIIAVHGVADQAPYVSAREIADLLIRNEPAAGPFYERGVRVAVEPVEVPTLSRADWDKTPADYTFMYGQLTGDIEGTGNRVANALGEETFESVCLTRTGTNQRPAVHIYEMYWADLSRLSTSFRRIFGEFYQLLFHISSLGRHTVDEARDSPRSDNTDDSMWKRLAQAQNLAAHMLTLPIPILNLILLGVVVGVIAFWLPVGFQKIVAAIVVGILVASIIGITFYRFFPDAPPAGPFLFATVPAVVTYFWVLAADTGIAVSAVFVPVCYFLISAALYLILRAYNRRRPGAVAWGIALWIVVTAVVVYCWSRHDDTNGVLLNTIEWILIGLTVFWTMLLMCHWFVAICGMLLKRSARRAAGSGNADAVRYLDKVQRVVWTGRLAVVLPTALFLIATLALWGALVYISDKVKPASVQLSYTPQLTGLYSSWKSKPYESFTELGSALLASSATPTAAFSLMLMLLAVILALWAFAPAVLAEVKPPTKAQDGASLGEWLDNGLKLLRTSGRFFFLAIVVVFPLGIFIQTVGPHVANTFFGGGLALFGTIVAMLPTSESIVLGAGAALAGTAVALVTFRSRLADVAQRLRPILDVALDVDNHLRELPLAANPRAKIAARYASLLRHVCNSGAWDGKPFDALVIVAHSQGTVITADLLRFLQHSSKLNNGTPADPRLARIDATAKLPDAAAPLQTPADAAGVALPVYLLTVGCPLRQLYGLRFPDLYDWARHGVDAEWKDPTKDTIDHGPDPKELNVRRWINAYRSGDYVGRYLWRPDNCTYRWESKIVSQSLPLPPDRKELCIGHGAHTHYFDDNPGTEYVATELRELIERP